MSMASTLEKELFSYILQLDDAEKQSVLQMLKTFLKDRKNTVYHFNIEQYNKDIDEAVARIESGHFYTQEEVEKMSKNW